MGTVAESTVAALLNARQAASHGRTAGGSIQAMNAGEYLFDVQPVGGSTCSAYRIYFHRSTTQGPTWPTW